MSVYVVIPHITNRLQFKLHSGQTSIERIFGRKGGEDDERPLPRTLDGVCIPPSTDPSPAMLPEPSVECLDSLVSDKASESLPMEFLLESLPDPASDSVPGKAASGVISIAVSGPPAGAGTRDVSGTVPSNDLEIAPDLQADPSDISLSAPSAASLDAQDIPPPGALDAATASLRSSSSRLYLRSSAVPASMLIVRFTSSSPHAEESQPSFSGGIPALARPPLAAAIRIPLNLSPIMTSTQDDARQFNSEQDELTFTLSGQWMPP